MLNKEWNYIWTNHIAHTIHVLLVGVHLFNLIHVHISWTIGYYFNPRWPTFYRYFPFQEPQVYLTKCWKIIDEYKQAILFMNGSKECKLPGSQINVKKCFKEGLFLIYIKLALFSWFSHIFFLPWASILRWLNCFLFILDVRHRSRSKSTVSIGKLFFSID